MKFKRPKIADVMSVVSSMTVASSVPLYIKLIGAGPGFEVLTQPEEGCVLMELYPTQLRRGIVSALNELEKRYNDTKLKTNTARKAESEKGTERS